jgi:hypothetical protein
MTLDAVFVTAAALSLVAGVLVPPAQAVSDATEIAINRRRDARTSRRANS